MTELPRCRTCRWWKVDTYYLHRDAYRECLCAKTKDDIHVLNGLYLRPAPSHKRTGPDFGCYLHEEKGEPK